MGWGLGFRVTVTIILVSKCVLLVLLLQVQSIPSKVRIKSHNLLSCCAASC